MRAAMERKNPRLSCSCFPAFVALAVSSLLILPFLHSN